MATPLRSSPVLIMSFVGSCGRRRGGRRARRSAAIVPWWLRIVADGDLAADHHDLSREAGQVLERARPGVELDEVLDAHAGLAGEVDPWLHAEHRRRRQPHVERGSAQRWALVGCQPDPVAKPVPVRWPAPVTIADAAGDHFEIPT